MKRMIGLALLVGLCLFGRTTAYAASVSELVNAATGTFETTLADGTGTAGTTFDSIGSFGPKQVIYGFKLNADTAGDSCLLLDAATVSSTSTTNATQGVYIDDLVQDTDERAIESDWPAPYILVTDLSVSTNGRCTIFHDVK